MQTRITPTQLALMSTGSMIGSGWLFSPFYGLQAAGGAVLLAWLLAAVVSLIVSLSFARMCAAFPVVGGTYRLLGITHPRSTANVFLILGWLSYVVFLPLEAQSVVQYLGFWWPGLVQQAPDGVRMSWSGLGLSVLILVGITWFNTLHITRVARANAWISVWKIVIPLLVALVVIIGFGRPQHFLSYLDTGALSLEPALGAVIGTGMAFAFAGFQNGLFLANQAVDPRRSLPFSLYLPLLLGLVLYALLSSCYMATLPRDGRDLVSSAAPLLGLVSVLGLGTLMHVLLADAVVAPMGTANVYAAVTGRILYACGVELRRAGWLTRLNRHGTPAAALWINAAVGLLFLLPLPTWKELVGFLTSVVVFAYLAGPITLLVLGRAGGPAGPAMAATRVDTVRARTVAVAGFLCCTWLVYWAGRHNLSWLLAAVLGSVAGHGWLRERAAGMLRDLFANAYLIGFIGALCAVAWLRHAELLAFPWDNVLAGAIGAAGCVAFLRARLDDAGIEQQVARLRVEQSHDPMVEAQVSP